MPPADIQYHLCRDWSDWQVVAGVLSAAGLGWREPASLQQAAVNDRATVFATAGSQLVGFGRFTVTHRIPRKAKIPGTETVVDIPAHKTVKFSAGKSLKSALN